MIRVEIIVAYLVFVISSLWMIYISFRKSAPYKGIGVSWPEYVHIEKTQRSWDWFRCHYVFDGCIEMILSYQLVTWDWINRADQSKRIVDLSPSSHMSSLAFWSRHRSSEASFSPSIVGWDASRMVVKRIATQTLTTSVTNSSMSVRSHGRSPVQAYRLQVPLTIRLISASSHDGFS